MLQVNEIRDETFAQKQLQVSHDQSKIQYALAVAFRFPSQIAHF